MIYKFFQILLILIVSSSISIYSRAFRVNQLPNGTTYRCLNCHMSIAGDGPLNPFGQDVSAKFLNSKGDVVWGPELANLDSDGDGYTNGQELQDPEGKWEIGDSDPGKPNLVTLPGDSTSKPLKLSIGEFDIISKNGENVLISTNSSSQGQLIISVQLDDDLSISLKIFSQIGEEIALFNQQFLKKGNNQIPFLPCDSAGNQLPNGFYFIQIEIKNKTILKPFILYY